MDGSTTNAPARAAIGRWSARILAVLAVAGTAIALFLVIDASLDPAKDDPKGDGKRTERTQTTEETPETYVVQPGDTLAGIAAKVGISVERIEQLNPEVDPQALPSGATLKLR
jgi:cobalamin biosynthesis protein CbiG